MSTLSALQEALHEMKLDDATLLIAGHADANGSERCNQRLSERRADAVKRALIENFKLDGDALTVVGYGKMRPKNITDPFADENRRVHIVSAKRK
jgi:outer membrane protein OmpA-like peptidoglycan-associated protein